MLENTDSIIFDLDGTLWDAAETVAKAWTKAKEQVDFVDHGLTADDVRAIAGTQHNLIFEKLFPELTKEQRAEFMKICSREEAAHIKKLGGTLYPELEETLEYLHQKYKLYIVSNCQDGYIEAFLKFHDLQRFFQDFECSGRTGNPKGDNLKDIIRRNNLENPVYVGDTMGDYEASVKAGVPFIFAKYGYRDVEEKDATLEQFSDLKQLF